MIFKNLLLQLTKYEMCVVTKSDDNWNRKQHNEHSEIKGNNKYLTLFQMFVDVNH